MNTTRLLNLGFLVCALVTGPLVVLGDEPPGELPIEDDDATAGVVRMIPAVDALEATAVPSDEQLSPATDVMRVLPTGGLDDVDTPVVPRDKMVGMRYRLDRQAAGSGVVGNDGGDTSFNLFWPFEANGDDRFMFLDVRALISDQGRGGTSLGMGYRSYNQQLDRIFGLSGWWDSDDSHHRTYQQAGASFESLGQFFDFRVNGYFPLSNEFHTVHDSTDLSNPYFGGFNLLVDRTRIYESNYRGLDTEVGVPLPVLGRFGARGFMGMYHWSSQTDKDTTGWKARIETQVTDDVMVGVSVSDDRVFGTNTWLNIVLTLPDGRPETFFRPQTMRQRLNGSVQRNHRVVVNRRRQVDPVALVNQSGANAGSAIQFVWVDPNAAFNGNGSVESPLNSLETYNNVPGNDMVIVGSGDLSGSLVLFDDQKLLSEWALNQQQYVFDTTSGLIPMPAVDPLATKPTFRNPLGVDGNDGGTIVTVAGSNTEIGGIIFDGQTDSSGVFANAITTAPGWTIGGFDFHDNEFDRTRNSVVFSNNASNGSGGPALGIFERNQLRGNGFDSIAGFQLTATEGSLMNLRVADNTISNYRGEDQNADGDLDPGEDTNGNGQLDAGVAISITANDRAVINAVSIPGDPSDSTDPGLPLGITGNIAVGNGTGLLLLTETEGVITADVSGNTFNNNFDPNTGVSMTADGGTINLLSFRNNDISDNLGTGMRLLATGGGTIASVVNEDRNRNGVLDTTEDVNGNGVLDVGEDLNGNGVLDGDEDINGNGVADHGFSGNTLIGNGGDGLVVVANDGSITDLNIGSPGDTVPDDSLFGDRAELDFNGDGFLNRGNGNGLLELGEDVNGNGVLDPGEDDNEDLNNNGIFDLTTDGFVGAASSEDLNGDGFLNTGNGNGILDPGEDVNENGLLDAGEDFDEDFNNNQVLDGPENVIIGNGIALGGTGSGIVMQTLPTEDLNGNGALDPGEDTNANGRLDLGGGVITGGVANNFLDNTIELDASGNPTLENNTGSQLSISSDGGSLGTGSITLSSVANNSMTGAGADAITINATNAGTVSFGEIKNNTLDNAAGRGIFATADTATIDLGTIENNTINRVFSGTDSVWISGVDSSLAATMIRNRVIGDSFSNIDTAGGITVLSSGGNLSLAIGQDDPAVPGALTLGNSFEGNIGSAIRVELQDNGTGQLAIRNNTIISTIDDLDPTTSVAGDAIHVSLVSANSSADATAVLQSSTISGNVIGDDSDPLLPLVNEGSGIVVRATEETTVQDLFISENTITGNLGDGILFSRSDNAVVAVVNPVTGQVRGVTINGNTITGHAGNGIAVAASGGNATQVGVELRDNVVTLALQNGIDLLTVGDADLAVDLNRNLVDENFGHGVQLREQFNAFDTEARQIGGTWSQNTIINNVGSGVSADARMAGLVIGIDGTDPSTGASLGNTITDNGADGIEINGFGDVVVANNSITGNGVLALGAGGGAGIDINWAPPAQAFTFIGKQFTLRGNTIQDNAGDGIEIQQAGALAGSQRLELVAESNDIRFNDLRGVDILNQDSGESFIRFGNGTSDGQNQIDNNGLEGFYVVNTASAVQNQIDTADVDLDATGAIDALPNMVLVLDENSVENNNQTGNFIAGGLVLRVGTSNSSAQFTGADADGINELDGNGVGTSETLDLLGNVIGNGRVNAQVTGNTLNTNNGHDVYIESFTSTVDPADTEDVWDDTDFDLTVFEGDPLARLNMVFSGNNGGSLQVTNGESDRSANPGFSDVVGAFYNNDEEVFKSRIDTETPPGPFTAGDRRRNAQRIAARDTLPPGTSPDLGFFEYPGMGVSTFRIETGYDTVDSLGAAPFAAGRGFLVDLAVVPPVTNADGIPFTLPVEFGELPFGWNETTSGTFDFSFPTLTP